jgi:ribosomal protein S6--L-glutamate ligase
MNIVVLSRGPGLYSTKRIVSVARRRGHRVEVLDPLTLSISISDGRARVYDGDHELTGIDAVIPRIGASVTYYGLAVLRQFEMQNAIVLNRSDAIANARDKLRCQQLLSGARIPMPDTAFSRRPTGSCGAIKNVGEGPLVIKLLEGTQGKGVMLAGSREAATSIIDAFRSLDEHILIQRFIAEAAGRDVRAFVVGGKVVAVMERQAKPGEFRSNLHMGGQARRIPRSTALERIALRATKALGLHVAGVDVLVGKTGPLVIEVNACPGLEGIEKTSGVNVAGTIIAQVEHLVAGGAKSTQTRRKRA